MSLHSHHISFRHAWDGLVLSIIHQPNFRIHIILSILVIFLGLWLDITHFEFVLLILVIFLGLVIELLNTAIEYVVDLITDQYHLLAKYAKDTAAAAMLVYACGSLLIASIILLPRLLFVIWPSI